MGKNTYKEAVDKVVSFWVEKSFNTPLNQNNGDDSPNGGIGFLLMNFASQSANFAVDNQQIEDFKSSLTNQLMELEGKPIHHAVILDVDYHPCRILAKACQDSGVSDVVLPCKTITWIMADFKAIASYQYHGERLEL
jgi:hypothetical protein